MRHSLCAIVGGLLLAAGMSGPAAAQTYQLTVNNDALFDIDIRIRLLGEDWRSWSGRVNGMSNRYYYIPIDVNSVDVEIKYHTGIRWNPVCSYTIAPMTSASITVKGSLFSRSCSINKH